jgi:uncharacterized protein
MKFLFESIILLILAAIALFVYREYWDDVQQFLFQETALYTIYLNEVAIETTIADEYNERVLGLSGVKKLRDLEGKLFIFDTDAKHGIWMKDMNFPIDIIWIDKNLQVIDIEENVSPGTYPTQIFAPDTDARFVLEVNAHLVSSVRIGIGDRLTLPPTLLPDDIEENLHN